MDNLYKYIVVDGEMEVYEFEAVFGGEDDEDDTECDR